MIEAQLYSHLSTHAGLSALVGNRIYPVQIPQGVSLPAVTYLRVSTQAVQHRSSAKPTYSRPRFQIGGWANNFDGALLLRNQLRAAMASFQTSSSPRVDVALMAGDHDLYEAEPNRWRCVLDYMISHEED